MTEFIDATGPGGIPGLRAGFEDREGSLWFGSLADGLIRLHDSRTHRFSTPEGLNDRFVWSLSAEPDGRRVWVGGNNGVSVFAAGRFKLVVRGDALSHPHGYNLLAEADRLWIGTRRGLAVIQHSGDKAGVVQQPSLFALLATAQINGFVRVDGGDLWIPTSEGLYRLRGDRLRRYDQADGLADPRTRYFHQARDGRVRVGTQSGLFEMRGDKFFPAGLDTGLPAGLDVTAITQLHDGRIVIGTLPERTFFAHGGRWHELSEAQGVPANSPFYLAEHDGYLWSAGSLGISRVPVADLTALASGRQPRVRGEMLLNVRGDPRSGQQGYCCSGAGNSKGLLRGNALWLPSRDGMPGEAHGVLIAPLWVITAAHTIPGHPQLKQVVINGKPRDVERLVIHSGHKKPSQELLNHALATWDWTLFSVLLSSSDDIALIKLVQPVNDVSPVAIHKGDDVFGQIVKIIGKGATGTGVAGYDFNGSHRTELRRAHNKVTSAHGRWFCYVFDKPSETLPIEGGAGGGDSGGPILVKAEGDWLLAGLTSWTAPHQGATRTPFGQYGQISCNVRLNHYKEWIEGVISAQP